MHDQGTNSSSLGQQLKLVKTLGFVRFGVELMKVNVVGKGQLCDSEMMIGKEEHCLSVVN